jgi:hypothetical protein
VDVTIYPDPNPALTAVLRGERMRSIVFEIGEIAHVLYVDQVAKRTGMLAASAHVSTEIGGVDQDRWIGVLTVGGNGVDYAATHEFGRQADVEGPQPESTDGVHNLDDRVRTGGHHAAHDLNRVLEELSGL